ncbi:MAG: NAD(P)-dependent oxidoreductase [Rikenellaceae bacterium]
MKVLIATSKPFSKETTDKISTLLTQAGHQVALLEKYTEKAELLAAVKDANAIIIRSDKVDSEVMAAAPELQIVVRAGAGYDNVDLACATERNIVVMNTPGQNANAVAELVIGMMIYTSRNLFTPGTGGEVMGKTIGLLGFGYIGKLVARKCKALGMSVVAYDIFEKEESFAAEGVERIASCEELFSRANFISLHIPATDSTKGMIGVDLVSKMPKGGVVINSARKEVINEAEMLEVMSKRDDIKYITDIAPSNAEAMSEALGKRYFAPSKKMGAETAEANLNAGVAAANQIARFFESGDVTFQVNK